jgi:hypothetical protein
MTALFIDDVRDPPKGGDWIVARTSAKAIEILSTGEVTYISFDYDLGGDDCGMLVVDWLDEKVFSDPSFLLPAWRIHSANPVGRERIKLAMLAMEARNVEA